jgi:hypothetical protein
VAAAVKAFLNPSWSPNAHARPVEIVVPELRAVVEEADPVGARRFPHDLCDRFRGEGSARRQLVELGSVALVVLAVVEPHRVL